MVTKKRSTLYNWKNSKDLLPVFFLPATKEKWFVLKIKIGEIKTRIYIKPAWKCIKGRRQVGTRSF